METSTDLARRDDGAMVERALLGGDLSQLSTEDRLLYYKAVCESLKLNPLTKPFDYMEMQEKGSDQKKLILYAKKDCTDQLRNSRQVNVKIVGRELVEGVYVVTAHATLPNGREDESIGAVPLVKEQGEWKTAQSGKQYFQSTGTFQPLSPDARANAIMKAETKAKRRVTLSICGLGLTDESELESMSNPQFPIEPAARKSSAPGAPHRGADRSLKQIEPAAATATNGQPLVPIDGNHVGTQAAADWVRAHNPWPAQTAAKPTAAPAAPDVPPAVAEMYQLMVAEKAAGFRRVFEMLREGLVNLKGAQQGREIYNYVLGLHGVDEWGSFKSLKAAQKCVLALFRKIEELSPKPAEADPDDAVHMAPATDGGPQELFA